MEHEEQVMGILSQVAKEYGVTLQTVLDEINQIIETGIHSEDPQVKLKWQEIPRRGTVPTPVELVNYCVNEVNRASDLPVRKRGFLRVVK